MCESSDIVCIDKQDRTVTGNTVSLTGDDLIPGLRYDTMIWANNVLGSGQNRTNIMFTLPKTGNCPFTS